jgi:hypothetical protein
VYIVPIILSLTLSREDEGGMIFVSCSALPTLFIAVSDENDIRDAIVTCLSNIFMMNRFHIDVFINSSIKEQKIQTMVILTNKSTTKECL